MRIGTAVNANDLKMILVGTIQKNRGDSKRKNVIAVGSKGIHYRAACHRPRIYLSGGFVVQVGDGCALPFVGAVFDLDG
jgi:hypothetical protein